MKRIFIFNANYHELTTNSWEEIDAFLSIPLQFMRKHRIFVRNNSLKYIKMGNVSARPTPRQLLVEVEDTSNLKDIKKAISMVKGVTKITTPRRRLTSYQRSLRDLDKGRVFTYNSLDDLVREIEG
jgi:hypothetical protein